MRRQKMKAQFNFDMDEPDDRMEHLRCLKSLDMALVLWELNCNSKKGFENKISVDSEMNAYDVLDMIFDEFRSLLDEHDINVDKLVQ